MKLVVRCHGIQESDVVCAHARSRVHFSLERLLNGEGTVSLHVSDVNGPRGGVDKHCGLRLTGRGFDFHVGAMDEDSRSAIDLACARAAEILRRGLDRRRRPRVA